MDVIYYILGVITGILIFYGLMIWTDEEDEKKIIIGNWTISGNDPITKNYYEIYFEINEDRTTHAHYKENDKMIRILQADEIEGE